MSCANRHAAWLTVTAGVFLLTSVAGWAATTAREEKQGDDTMLVLENESTRLVVSPAADAAITEYRDKKSGVNFVAGEAVKGRAAYAWKDVTRLHPNDPPGEWFGSKPYRAGFKDGDGYKAIVATCEAGGLRVEREMRLANGSVELKVLMRHTNTSTESRGVWLR
jgi:hypothetical protein